MEMYSVIQNENHVIYVYGRPVNIIGIDDYSTNRSDLNASYAGWKPFLR